MSDIRQARKSDLPELLKLIRPFRSPAFNWGDETFRSEFDNVETWVLEKEGQVAAFVCLRDAIDAFEVSVLATRRDLQGEGCMRSLLSFLIARYGKERHFWLEVHEKNIPAQKLYEKLGFINDGSRGGYYTDGSSALLYSLLKKKSDS